MHARLRRWRIALTTVRSNLALFSLAGALVVAIAGSTAGLLWHLRVLELDEATREIANLNLVIAEQAARSIKNIDFVLREMSERLSATDAGAGGRKLSEKMAALLTDTPQMRSIVVAGADGQVVERFPASLTSLPFYIGDRSLFIAQRDGTASGLFISEPYLARADGQLSVGLSRRVNGPDGAFAGVVASGLKPGYFSEIYGALDLHKTSAVALYREDGVCLTRYPAESGVGTPCTANPTVARYHAAALSGIYRDTDPTSRAEHIVAYHHVGGLPLVSMVSASIDTVLEEWRRQVLAFSAAGLLAGVILCGLIFLLAKEAGRSGALAATLRMNEERFRNFAEASSDWFWEQDENLRFTYLTAAAFENSRLAVTDHMGKTRRETLPRGVTAEQWRQHDEDLAAQRPFRDFRLQRIDFEGRTRHISVNGKPVLDDSGRFRGYAGNARDITEQIESEQRLLDTKAEAEAANRTKSDFLAVISHELRTPLNAIIGFSDVMSREILGPIGSVRYREYAGDILEAGQHLLGLINNILDLSKIEARKMELFDETIQIGTLVASCVKIIERQAAAGQVALAIDIPADLPNLRGDEMRLKQILLNLLSNAVKFTPAEGWVTLTARLLADGALEIAVADSGIGMNESEIAIAMQPFRQVESALARKHEGSGLGLPLVKAFTEMHGGRLVLRSAPGSGTTAQVIMPAERVVTPIPARLAAG